MTVIAANITKAVPNDHFPKNLKSCGFCLSIAIWPSIAFPQVKLSEFKAFIQIKFVNPTTIGALIGLRS